MAKIAPVSAKYIINASINIDGVVDRSDVIGAIFGQTEGLLGSDLELRELQRSGRIGRIEVNVDTKGGKTNGRIIIPSSMDKSETAIIGAATEIIERIGPCNAKILVENIEDVRIAKRNYVIDRAKELLKTLTDQVLPDSQEIAETVSSSVRQMEIVSWGPEKLSAGPAIAEAEELIIVEGRADVLNLLKCGFKNVIAVGGTGIPKTIAELTNQKTVTVFVDGDRGGDLIIRELSQVAEVDFVTKAPDGKEVEELTKKEIHKALRGKISLEQGLLEIETKTAKKEESNFQKKQNRQQNKSNQQKDQREQRDQKPQGYQQKTQQQQQPYKAPQSKITDDEKETFKETLEDLIGTRGAYILDSSLNILGKVPTSELITTIKSLGSGSIFTLVMDGEIEKDLVETADKIGVKYLVANTSKIKSLGKLRILTENDLN